MKMIRLFSILALLVLSGSLCAMAATRASTDEFIQKAAAGNQFEIDTSKLAQEKSTDPKVKDFARQMIADHTQAGINFKAALAKAQKDNPPPDSTPDADQKKALDDLGAATDGDFDKKYVDVQLNAHNQTVDLFEDYIKNGDDKNIKDFAKNTLPTLQHHQQMAQDLKASM